MEKIMNQIIGMIKAIHEEADGFLREEFDDLECRFCNHRGNDCRVDSFECIQTEEEAIVSILKYMLERYKNNVSS